MTKHYRISDLDVASTPVFFLVGDQKVAGFVWFTRAGKPRYRIGSLRNWTELPADVEPGAWWPVDEANWPEPLPDPIRLQPDVDWKSPPEPHSEPEKPQPEGGWPYPNLRLGRAHEPPASPQEAEARILRFLRTAAVLEHDPVIRECAWPKDLMIAANVVAKSLHSARSRKLATLREEDYRDFHLGLTDEQLELRPLLAPWTVTARDVSDYESDHGPRKWKYPSKAIFAWRASRPPYSFFQIARELKLTETEVRTRYADACETAYRSARK